MPNEKRPAEVKDYLLDWTRRLLVGGEDVGDAISSSAWEVEAGLTKDSDTKTDKTTTVWVSGGTEGTHYTVTNRVVTTQGRTLEWEFVVQLRAALVG